MITPLLSREFNKKKNDLGSGSLCKIKMIFMGKTFGEKGIQQAQHYLESRLMTQGHGETWMKSMGTSIGKKCTLQILFLPSIIGIQFLNCYMVLYRNDSILYFVDRLWKVAIPVKSIFSSNEQNKLYVLPQLKHTVSQKSRKTHIFLFGFFLQSVLFFLMRA